MAPAQDRLGDEAKPPADAHGCPACPHPAVDPAITGSPTVNVDGLPALRVTDLGIHAACCGPNTWLAKMGSSTLLIDGLPAHRKGDMTQHYGLPVIAASRSRAGVAPRRPAARRRRPGRGGGRHWRSMGEARFMPQIDATARPTY